MGRIHPAMAFDKMNDFEMFKDSMFEYSNDTIIGFVLIHHMRVVFITSSLNI